MTLAIGRRAQHEFRGKKMNPLVSVLTPLYNTNPDQLRETIESVLRQTYSHFEFLILNDSPENKELEKIVRGYGDGRIQFYCNPENLGISRSRNTLIHLAKGKYLAILDHDDVCYPNRLEMQVSYLEGHPEIGLCSGLMSEIPSGKISKNRFPETNLEIKSLLLKDNCIVHSAMMVRRSLLIDNNIAYEEKFSPAEDYMLCVRLMEYTQFHNLQFPLIRYRIQQSNASHRQAEAMQDRRRLISSIAHRSYGQFGRPEDRTIYLLGIFPLLRVKRVRDERRYLLFGCIPIVTVK